MIRRARVSQGTEVLHYAESRLAGFFRMKLHPEDIGALKCGSKRLTVLAYGSGGIDHGSAIRVGEIKEGRIRNALRKARGSNRVNLVPANVRRIHCSWETCAYTREEAESSVFDSFFAALEQPLQAQANPQKRCASLNAIPNCLFQPIGCQ